MSNTKKPAHPHPKPAVAHEEPPLELAEAARQVRAARTKVGKVHVAIHEADEALVALRADGAAAEKEYRDALERLRSAAEHPP